MEQPRDKVQTPQAHEPAAQEEQQRAPAPAPPGAAEQSRQAAVLEPQGTTQSHEQQRADESAAALWEEARAQECARRRQRGLQNCSSNHGRRCRIAGKTTQQHDAHALPVSALAKLRAGQPVGCRQLGLRERRGAPPEVAPGHAKAPASVAAGSGAAAAACPSGACAEKLSTRCAFKCSYAVVNGEGVDVVKDPITDPGKKSKKGKLTLELTEGTWTTIAEGNGKPENDQLVEVFRDGRLLRDYNFDDIRKRSAGG